MRVVKGPCKWVEKKLRNENPADYIAVYRKPHLGVGVSLG